jgi:hypothetical protein
MTLEEIAATWAQPTSLRVPEWALGTVMRRSITFATGVEDTETRVFWVQAHGMTGDIRIHPARPRIASEVKLASLDREALCLLASVEGGIATTSWSEPVMSWANWIGFQTYDKYPEPGIMRRIGDCMIEFAPSGIYVEDWRFQPSAPGLLAGLRLESEEDEDGIDRPRAGGLVVAGDHAIRVLARREDLPECMRAQDFVRESADPVAALAQVFDCITDYLVREGALWRIEASTDPRREGLRVPLTGDLEAGRDTAVLWEAVNDMPGVRRRRWHIDSLEVCHTFTQATPAPADRLAWLENEADTLIQPIDNNKHRVARCA